MTSSLAPTIKVPSAKTGIAGSSPLLRFAFATGVGPFVAAAGAAGQQHPGSPVRRLATNFVRWSISAPVVQALVLYSGCTTSSPSSEMQADVDALRKLEGLRADKYQLQRVELSV